MWDIEFLPFLIFFLKIYSLVSRSRIPFCQGRSYYRQYTHIDRFIYELLVLHFIGSIHGTTELNQHLLTIKQKLLLQAKKKSKKKKLLSISLAWWLMDLNRNSRLTEPWTMDIRISFPENLLLFAFFTSKRDIFYTLFLRRLDFFFCHLTTSRLWINVYINICKIVWIQSFILFAIKISLKLFHFIATSICVWLLWKP